MARVKNYKVGAGRDPDIFRSRPTLKLAFVRAYAAYANRERASGRSPLPPVQWREAAAALQPSSRQGRLAGRVCLSGAGAD